MERDFMGLAAVKQETSDEEEPIQFDAVPLRSASAAMDWPLSNKSYAHPHLFPFHNSVEERPKTGFDSLTSAGLVTITTTEVDSDHQPYSAIMPKNIVPENQGGVRYRVNTYPTASVHQSFAPLSPQPISAIPTVPSMPSSSSVVGTTDLRNSSKISGAPAQLTMFFNGAVCVFDNVSADKAEAIMLLAGDGPSTAGAAAAPTAPVQASAPRHSILESSIVNRSYGSIPTAKAAPISVSQPMSWASAISQNQGGVHVSANKVELLKVNNSPTYVPAPALPSSSVPQFRRKSLARFLEKRKERVMGAAPYGDKESPAVK